MPDRFCLLAVLILIFSILSPFNGVDAVPISRVSSSDLSHMPNGLMKPRYILPISTTNKSSSDCEVIVETVEGHPVSTPYVVVVKGSPGLVGFVRLMYNDLRDIPVAISIQIHIGASILVPFFVIFVLVACLGFVSGPEDQNDYELEDYDCDACNHRDLEEKVESPRTGYSIGYNSRLVGFRTHVSPYRWYYSHNVDLLRVFNCLQASIFIKALANEPSWLVL
ncbi:hypothetical protein EV359DRAFT_67676 [Lentinula novae-zelandiae]|nr:hypothetical protein EV359DRAFT_67676 [Lentinula novae-zelandiae]